MRFLRFAVIGALLAVIAAGIAALYAIRHQTQIVRMVLAQIDQRTGLHIAIAGARLAFRGRLVVVLEKPRVAMGGREIAHLTDIRATLSYGSIIHHSGLPLNSLILDQPAVKLPPMDQLAPAGGIGQIGPNAAALVMRTHALLSDVCRRVDVNGAGFADASGKAIADDIYILAFQRHPRVRKSAWDVKFRSRLKGAPADGVRLAGHIRLGGVHTGAISIGRLWFWNLNLDQAGGGGLWMSAQAHGGIRYALRPEAELSGATDIYLLNAIAGGKRLNQSIALGAYSFHAAYQATPARLDITKFALRGALSKLIEGSASIAEPFSAARTVTFSAGGPSFELTRMPGWLRSMRSVPPALTAFTERFRSGKLTIAAVSLNAPEPLSKLTPAALRQKLSIEATLAHASYAPMPGLNLPPVEDFDTQIAYSKGIARLTQGTGRIGGSSIADMSVTADLRRAPARIPYRTAIAGQVDVGELYSAVKDALNRTAPRLRRLAWIHGHAPFSASASGALSGFTIAPPPNYTVEAKLGDIELAIDNTPSAIALKSGSVTLRPGKLNVDRAAAVMIDEKTGSALLNGEVITGRGAPLARNLSVELHQIEIGDWLPMFVNPSQLAASGLVGGRLVANSDPARGPMPVVTGRLTLGPGTMQPGFLRSPMVIGRSATLELDGKGMALDMPACKLERAPLDFRLAIADLHRPVLRIDAKASRLDFEVMRFIRPPWAPKTPPASFPLPAAGHIEAREGNFAKLAMTDISTDFSHDSQVWRVYNFHAKAFDGDARLQISGSGLPSDNWINIKGWLNSMNAGPLFMLAGRQKRSPLTGKLNATADLWANTDVNFFSTLAGGMKMKIADGSLDRFTLLTRILSFIDLKNWLTANFPDPRVSGIPFKTLTADFKGRGGDFYTNNLTLDGPVMDITANGNVQLADGRMNMEVGLIPFNTANWIVEHIPLIGNNLARGSNGLVAAYFRVRGPIRNPSIMPKPITSVAEFVIRTLSLPINIIKPNTVK